MLVELLWHFVLFNWVSPRPNEWDMGGVAGTVQLFICLGFLITALLIFGMALKISAARIALIVVSLCAAILGVLNFMNLEAIRMWNFQFVKGLIYIAFNLLVSILLITVRHYRPGNPRDGDPRL